MSDLAYLDLRSLTKRFGAFDAIRGVDLTIARGEFVALVGPSGCGKSTLLRMIAGLERVTGGEIVLDDVVVNELDPHERNVAMVFQNYALYPHMTVSDNVGFNLKIAGMGKAERQKRVEAVARLLSIEQLLDRRPSELSGGQRQRVAMGRAIVRSPNIFLFDEPLSNLDAKLRVQMRGEIKRLHSKVGVTSVYVTHDQIEAMTLADRVIVMNAGRIEQIGTPLDLYNRPDSVFVAGFIGSPSMSFLTGRAERDAGVWTLAHPGGRIPLPARLSPRDGQELTLGLRPETLTAGDGAARLEATVLNVEPTGAQTYLTADCGGAEVVAAMPPTWTGVLGERLFLGFDPELAHVFDKATGRRAEGGAPPVPAHATVDAS